MNLHTKKAEEIARFLEYDTSEKSLQTTAFKLIEKALQEAVAEERERCAKIARGLQCVDGGPFVGEDAYVKGFCDAANKCEDEIRSAAKGGEG